MANKAKPTLPAKKSVKDPGQVLINYIDIRQIQRTFTDIDLWRSAIQTAESVVNPTRRTLYNLYFEMLLDGYLSAVINKRLTAIANANITFTDEDGNEVEQVREMMESEGFEEVITEILNSKFWGFTLLDLEFDGNIILQELIDRRHVKPEFGLVVKNPSDMEGLDFTQPPYDKFVLAAGKKKDLGLLMKVAQYVIYKRGNFGDWAQFAELFGMPFRKATYDGYDENARVKMLQALQESGSASYVVLPEGTTLDFIANTSTGGSKLYDSLRKACNEEISVTIMGTTLTTSQGDKGSRSLGEVHADMDDELHLADKRYVKKILNSRLIPILEANGFPVKGCKFSFPEVEHIDKQIKIGIDMQIANRQPVSDDYFYEEYGIPKPEDYDQLKQDQKLDKEMMQKLANNQPPPPAEQAKNILDRLKSFF